MPAMPGAGCQPLAVPVREAVRGGMSDELTPSDDATSDDVPSDDATNPGAPQGAPAPSDTPVHDQPTAAGQAPAGGAFDGENDFPADDETADTLQNDALLDEEQP
jgi:hypothetical protein